MLSRRHALRLGLTAGMSGLLAPFASSVVAHAGPADVAAAGKYTVPLTVPRRLAPLRRDATTDHYRIITRRSRVELLPGVRTEVLTYNGTVPGPTIVARTGRRVVVEQVNTLDRPTSMHLHGGNVPTSEDGGTMGVTVPPRGRRVHTYDNQQRAATLWMHDHAHHLESENVYRGLSGQYLLTDPAEDALGLPSGRHDVPLVLRDAAFDDAGEMVYTLDDAENRSTILVNGRPWPRMRVQGRRYRLRIVNACNLRFFVLQLADYSPMTQIGSDGGLLPAPFEAPVVVLSPGERADIVIDFSRYAPGTQLVLNNLIGPGPVERIGTVMRFDVGAPVPDPSGVPAVLSTLPPLPTPTVDRAFVLRMDEHGVTPTEGPATAGHEGHGAMLAGGTINGAAYDPARIDTTIAWGTTERWTVTNASTTIPHNFHMHLAQFRVLDRDGQPPSPAEAGFKDTVQIFPGQSVALLVTFDSHRGVYPYHCHMIDHSAMGMMGQMEIV